MPIYSDDFPISHPVPLRSSVGNFNRTTIIDEVDKWLDEHPDATIAIEDGSISTVKLASRAVTNAKLASKSVSSEKIADGAVTTRGLADNSVTGDKIAEKTITSTNLADGSIRSSSIHDLSITGDKLADRSVTFDKLAGDALPTMTSTTKGVATVGAGLSVVDGAITLDATGDISDAISDWLDGHPEATTTVDDGSVSTQKLADKAVTAEKLDDLVQVAISRGYKVYDQMPNPVYDSSVNPDTGRTRASAGYIVMGRMEATAVIVGSVPCNVHGYENIVDSQQDAYVGIVNTTEWVTNTIVVVPDNMRWVIIELDARNADSQDAAVATVKRCNVDSRYSSDVASRSLLGKCKTLKTSLNDAIPDYELFDATNMGVNYKTKVFRPGRYWTDGTENTTAYIRTLWNLKNLFGDLPSALRVRILDTSELVFPRIFVGNSTVGFKYGITDSDDATFEITDRDDTVVTIGIGYFPFIAAATATREQIEDRVIGWVNDNLEVTAYFESDNTPVGRYCGLSVITYNDEELKYKYDSAMEWALKLPDTYKVNGDPTPMILFSHGYDQELNDSYWSNEDAIHMINQFANAGYAVMDVDETSAHHYDWCNPKLFRKYLDALTDITSKYNVRLDFIYADSMGGLNALFLQQLLHPKACVISALRLDFEARWPNFTEAQQNQILVNFGIGEWDQDFMKQWFLTIPEYTDKDDMPANPCRFVPTLYLYGTDDSYVSESIAKIDAMSRGGNVTKTLGYTANHHKMCYLMDAAIPIDEGQPTCMEATLEWFDTWSW